MHLSGPTNRLWAAFRNLVKAGLFASRVVVEDLLLSVFRQGLIRLHIGLIAARNGRHPALGRRFVGIYSGQVWNGIGSKTISGGPGLDIGPGIGRRSVAARWGLLRTGWPIY